MSINKQCYMCGMFANTREHVPPLCLFPEMKDTKGVNLRKNLITVPSCKKHNLKKSDDDEFLMLALAGLYKNNDTGVFHQMSKGSRALKRKSKDFLEKEILRNLNYKEIPINEENQLITVKVGNPNFERLYKCFEHIGYGLYHHVFEERFMGELKIIMGFIEYEDDNFQTLKKFLKRRFEVEKELNTEELGSNKEVFSYQFHKPDKHGFVGLRMVFYGTAEVYFSFKNMDSEIPFNLGWYMINNGIHSYVNLGDEQFEFNKDSEKK